VVRVIGMPAGLGRLAAEFPDYEFGTQRTWHGISIIAVRQGGSAQPGLYAVITADLDEMRCALVGCERPARRCGDADETSGP
jgi:hypothetical protein